MRGWKTMGGATTLAAGLAFASWAPLGSGCGCEEVGCTGTLRIDLGDLPEGEYTVDLRLDDAAFASCTFPVPLPDDEVLTVCNSDLVGVIQTASNTTITVATSMTDGPPFESVAVELYDDEDALLSETDEVIAWDKPVYPNGKRCDAPFGCYSGIVFMPRS